jgi:NO-binding membrane sensor protein with MHYT domain
MNLDIVVHSDKISRMCQARVSVGFNSVLVWTLLASLTFGFCSIWSLHFVAMLAYELDILIGINVPLTILSSVLAVVFTFAALGSDLLWATYSRERQRKNGNHKRRKAANGTRHRQRGNNPDMDSRPLLSHAEDVQDFSPDLPNPDLSPFELDRVEVGDNMPINDNDQFDPYTFSQHATGSESARKIFPLPGVHSSMNGLARNSERTQEPTFPDCAESTTGLTDSSEPTTSRRSSSLPTGSSSINTFGLSSIVNIAYRSTLPAKNIFIATGEALYLGFTIKNIAKGFLWSLAITSMHYAGIAALSIPSGYYTLNYFLVVLSGIISWLVCVVGCILMSQMETHLGQQFLFSIAATSGVTGMHFTGKSGATTA